LQRLQSAKTRSARTTPCLIVFNGFHVMVAGAKFDFFYQASYINGLKYENEMLQNQMNVSYGGKDEI